MTGTPSTNPKIEIHSKATEVHGISAAKLEKAPTTEFILPIFMKWVGASPLVAHNAKFDNRLLLQDLTVLKLEKLVDQKPTFCTMKYFRKNYPKCSYGLADAAGHFDIVHHYKTAHTALADAETLAQLFQNLLQKFGKKKPQTPNTSDVAPPQTILANKDDVGDVRPSTIETTIIPSPQASQDSLMDTQPDPSLLEYITTVTSPPPGGGEEQSQDKSESRRHPVNIQKTILLNSSQPDLDLNSTPPHDQNEDDEQQMVLEEEEIFIIDDKEAQAPAPVIPAPRPPLQIQRDHSKEIICIDD